MQNSEQELASAPTTERGLELWLQHAAGYIFFRDIREFASQQIEPSLPAEARVAAQKGINAALYGLMMVLDGVTGQLSNERQKVELGVVVRLLDRKSRATLAEVNLANGDGMCMGYHGWLESDFGKDPIVNAKTPAAPAKRPAKKAAKGRRRRKA